MSIRNNYLRYFLVFSFALLITSATWAAQSCPKENLTAYKITFIEDDGKKVSAGEIQLPDLNKIVNEFCGYWKQQEETYGEDWLYKGYKGNDHITVRLHPHINDAGHWFQLDNNKQWFQEGQLMADSAAGHYVVGKYKISAEPPPENIKKIDRIYESKNSLVISTGNCKSFRNATKDHVYFACTENLKELESNLNNFLKVMVPTLPSKRKTHPYVVGRSYYGDLIIDYYKKINDGSIEKYGTKPLEAKVKNLIKSARFIEAEKLLKSKTQKRKDKSKSPDKQKAMNYYLLSLIQDLKADFPASIQYLQSAVDFAPNNPFYLSELGGKFDSIGSRLRLNTSDENPKGLKELQTAISLYEKALAIDLKKYGPNHSKVAEHWERLSSIWFSLDDYAEAVRYLKQLVVFQNSTLGPEHPTTQETKFSLKFYERKLKGEI